MGTERDPRTGRPLYEGDDAVETLTDPELEAELTIALFDEERREHRIRRLEGELQRRRRRQRIRRTTTVNSA